MLAATSRVPTPVRPAMLHIPVLPSCKTRRGVVATLGPAGTSSEQAGRYLAELLGMKSGQIPIRLEVSYEAARDRMMEGSAERLLVANAYQAVHSFYMDLRLELEQVFVMDTPQYGLAARPDLPLPVTCRVATHPAPRDLIDQLMPPGYRVGSVEITSSTSMAAEEAAKHRVDLALTTEPAARLHRLQFVSPARPIRMVWSVFTRKPQFCKPRHRSVTRVRSRAAQMP